MLRHFVRDRANQLALGLFLATFVYALTALREVRGEDGSGDRFVPGITIAVAFLLVMIAAGVFVAYIAHVAQSIRVENIIGRIADETDQAIERLYPDGGGGSADPALPPSPPGSGSPPRVVRADGRGVVVRVDVDALVREATRVGGLLRLVPAVGAFVPAGAAILELHGARSDLDGDGARSAVVLGRQRGLRQDAGFGLRQLVDVAEKALSPGINDPTTAVQCLDQLHHLLRRLATRRLDTGHHRDPDGAVRLVVPVPDWSDYVHLALDEIRHWGAASLQVQTRIRTILDDLDQVVGPERRAPLAEQRRLLAE